MMITIEKIGELQFEKNKNYSHLSAASGLIKIKDWLYVIADDENFLGVFPANLNEPGYAIPIFPGQLPKKKKARKAEKPDLEGITFLPAFSNYPHGALLALGSGSRDNRQKGMLLKLDSTGMPQDNPVILDFSLIYAALKTEFEALNIEGITVTGDMLCLLQRGNKHQSKNAVIDLELSPLLHCLAHHQPLTSHIKKISSYDLGEIEGIPFCFTDITALPNGELIFTAVAENTKDNYLDGTCLGSAIGILNHNREIYFLKHIHPSYKIEGIHAELTGDRIHALLVTDDDNPAIAASVLHANFKIETQ